MNFEEHNEQREERAPGSENSRQPELRQMVESLVASGALRSAAIVRAFEMVDRADFVPPGLRETAYEDRALPIRHGQTISQPSVVAFMLELLEPCAGEKILDLGSGSGWTTALLAEITGPRGEVAGVELIPELAAFGRANLAKYGFPQASIVEAGEQLGLPDRAPFEKILVSAAAAKLPLELADQLANGGVMVIPVGHELWRVWKNPAGGLGIQRFGGFSFVPLRTALKSAADDR